MSNKAKLLKTIVKGTPEKSTFGTDPRDPWSAKANIAEDAALDKFLLSRGINPKFVSKDTKVAHSKTGEFLKWKQDHMMEQKLHTPTGMRLDVLKKKEHKNQEIRTAPIHNKLHSEEVDEKDVVSMDIPLLIRVLELAREDLKSDADLHRVVEKLIEIRNKGTLTMNDYDFVAKLKEEFDPLLEDIYQDSKAATQTVCDCGTTPDDTVNARTKSARIIKSLYKKKGMTEEIYDHEKEDKSVATYGKKPLIKVNNTKSSTDNPNKAAIIMKGGKTLTGQGRDTVEIDPEMKRPKGGDSPQDIKTGNR